MFEETHAVDPSVVDIDRVRRWMAETGLGDGPVEDVSVLGGGTQNVLLRLRQNDREYVLRRPPPHKRSDSDRTIEREASVLGALAGSAVPHPGLIAVCPDLSVIGAAFYLMEPAGGRNPCGPLPPGLADDPGWQRMLGLSIVDGLLALSEVRPAEVGLADLGKPRGWLERQVSRWRGQLVGYGRSERYEPGSLGPVGDIANWLDTHRPADHGAGLIHGDFHLANMLVADDGTLAAIVDWELSTQGDPLLDLGHLLATWPGEDNPAGVDLAVPLPWLPTVDELLAHYLRRTSRNPADVHWFRVLACYRLAIILEGTYVRSMSGQAARDTGIAAHERAKALLGAARRLVTEEGT
ncbi:phosphotransferase family protein [Saccharomonospora sp. NPDC006951]